MGAAGHSGTAITDVAAHKLDLPTVLATSGSPFLKKNDIAAVLHNLESLDLIQVLSIDSTAC